RVWFEGELIGLNIGRVVEMGNPLKDCDGMLVDVGVPHYVVPVEKVDVVDVGGRGRELRHRKEFPEGANIDFVEYVDSNTIKVKTYERGVEGETLSCGTGAVASAYVSYVYGRCKFPVTIINPGGNLKVGIKYTTDGVQELSLMGGARLIFKGVWVDE
ncbi:MAG: diaminopimelate epimerase, partial [Synergistetes bacterium]|nr:diaminopimelate epimerase [Synergistota bacterium]